MSVGLLGRLATRQPERGFSVETNRLFQTQALDVRR
jgi:hypothetical protein